MKNLLGLVRCYYTAARLPEYLAPALDLGLRLFVAIVFFKSGMTKIKTWDSTLYLFSDVYQVPLLDPEIGLAGHKCRIGITCAAGTWTVRTLCRCRLVHTQYRRSRFVLRRLERSRP